MKIDIPEIVPRDLWERNQARLERRKRLSTRNAKGVYLLQGLAACGDCGRMMATRQKRYGHAYFCCFPNRYPNEPHPRSYNRSGIPLDWQVWRRIVDCGIKQPNLIRKQIQDRQVELQAQGDSVGSDIAHVRQRLAEIDNERASYQRQAARGKINETEFDARMEETEEGRIFWQAELDQLAELRDNRAGVRAGLDYAIQLLTLMQERLGEIDIQPDELRKLPEKQRAEILRERRRMIQALCDRVLLYANGRVVIEGVLDGSEAAEFELASSTPCGHS